MKIDVLATGSTGNAYYVYDGETGILLDCGISYKDIERKMGYHINNIRGVLVSHAHSDHSLCVDKMALNGFEVSMPQETAEQLNIESCLNIRRVSPGKTYSYGTISYKPFELVHYNTDDTACINYGYLLFSCITEQWLLYITDTAYVYNRFPAVDYMLLETNYEEGMLDERNIVEVEKRRRKSHMSLENAVEFLKSNDTSRLKELYAIHRSKTRSNPDHIAAALKGFAERVIVP